MIIRVVDFALAHRPVVMLVAAVLVLTGLVAFERLPIEAYPDVADTWVELITQWDGHAAEEMETQVTIPIETVMNGIPRARVIRSTTIAGLSSVNILFDEGTDDGEARRNALERFGDIKLPDGVLPSLGPMASPTGEILRFALVNCAEYRVDACSAEDTQADPLTLTELRDLQEYVVERDLFAVDGVADVSTFGGTILQYQVLVDADRMLASGVAFDDVVTALSKANQNGGGGTIEYGEQSLNVRALGTLTPEAIPDVVVTVQDDGDIIRVGDVAEVERGFQTRLGRVSIDDRLDIVGATVVMRRGEHAGNVLPRLHAAISELNDGLLPRGVKVDVYQDRTELTRRTTTTVLANLVQGVLLVSLVLLLFLGNLRAALIVTVTIPLSLLFAFVCMDGAGIPANLLSLGAIDFGMIVDGSIVMMENIFRRVASRGREDGEAAVRSEIHVAAKEVARPIVFAIGIIIAAYLPIFTLQSVEGKIFGPMAWTVAFALTGALVLAVTLVPALASFAFRGAVRERRNPVLEVARRGYRPVLGWFMRRRWAAVALVAAILGADVLLYRSIGSEFLPHLNEGALTVHAQLPVNVSLNSARRLVDGVHGDGENIPGIRDILRTFPEVATMVIELGRPDDGTDPSGFYNAEFNLFLKDRTQWRPEFDGRRDRLEEALSGALSAVPGVQFSLSQPIADNVEEAMNGVKGELAVKVVGPDLFKLDDLARSVAHAITDVPGIKDVSLNGELGQANLHVAIDRTRAERYGLTVADVEAVVDDGLGGSVATVIREGERAHDLVVRYAEGSRSDRGAVERVPVPISRGGSVPLAEVADVSIRSGAARIYREESKRYVAVTFSVRGRDMGSAVAEAQARVARAIPPPAGYEFEWGGEFQSAQRATRRLTVVVPITILLIFALLSMLFRRLRESTLVLLVVLITSPVGGMAALWMTGLNFSVSSAVGFLALFGVSVQTGVILVSYMNERRAEGMALDDAILEACDLRLRPVMMTALVASLGLLPAALSTDIGSDSQRPLAVVIVGGLVSALALSLVLLPTFYRQFAGGVSASRVSAP